MSAAHAPVQAALLGTGAWAGVLARAAAPSEHIAVRACWSRTPDRVRAFATTHGIRPEYHIEAVLEDPEIDAVIVALPNDLHHTYAALAARHGKHVFIEKPIASTLEQGLAIAELERAHGVRIAVGHCARMLAGNRMLASAVRDGELGRVSHVDAVFANDRGLRLTRDDWRWHQRSAPGGPLSQIAIHQLDTMRAIGGDIATIAARAARLSPVGAEVEDQWVLSLGFADGKLGSLFASWTSPGRYSVRVTGERASLHYEIDQALWADADRLHEHAVLEKQERGQSFGTRTRIAVPPGNMFREELEHFAACIRSGAACELSAENACLALAAVDAAIASAAVNGASVAVADVMAAARWHLRPSLTGT